MTAPLPRARRHTAPVQHVDGRAARLADRTEPKVKTTTGAAAFLVPLAVYYAHALLNLLPGAPAEGWSLAVTLPMDGLVGSVVVFVVGYATKAVNRVDL